MTSKPFAFAQLAAALLSSTDPRWMQIAKALPNAPRRILFIPLQEDGTTLQHVRLRDYTLSAQLQFTSEIDDLRVWCQRQAAQGRIGFRLEVLHM